PRYSSAPILYVWSTPPTAIQRIISRGRQAGLRSHLDRTERHGEGGTRDPVITNIELTRKVGGDPFGFWQERGDGDSKSGSVGRGEAGRQYSRFQNSPAFSLLGASLPRDPGIAPRGFLGLAFTCRAAGCRGIIA